MQKSAVQKVSSRRRINPRTLAMTAILGAVATVLMMLSFSLPVIPSFVKLDFSELPALIAAFSMGPVSGVVVCFIKNLVNLAMSTTGGAGELCNFLMGVTFVVPAGLLYKFRKDRWGALWGSLLGAVIMAAMSFPINLYISYPAYTVAYGLTIPQILGMYQAINPAVETLAQALLWFNVPFTFFKAACDVAITFAVYKRISPLIHGQGKRLQA